MIIRLASLSKILYPDDTTVIFSTIPFCKMVKLTIAAPSKKLADACFADGNSVVREKMKKNSRKGMRSGPKKSKKSYVRRTYNRSKKNVKVVPPVENTRPMLVYPEPVTGSTDWGEYIERFDKYQKNNPNFKVV